MISENKHEELVLEDSIHTSERSWFERTFSSLNKDSMRGGIFILLLTALGTGMFSLHHLFDSLGIIWTFVYFLLIVLNFYFCLKILAIAANKKREENSSLNNLIGKYLGPRFLSLYNVIFFTYLFIVLTHNVEHLSPDIRTRML